jgi:hypothetical protein
MVLAIPVAKLQFSADCVAQMIPEVIEISPFIPGSIHQGDHFLGCDLFE